MKKIIFGILLVSTFLLFSPGIASAGAPFVNFGGRILMALPPLIIPMLPPIICPYFTLFVGPPKPLLIIVIPGVSQVRMFWQVYRPGPWALGMALPFFFINPFCPYPPGAPVVIMGSSLF